MSEIYYQFHFFLFGSLLLQWPGNFYFFTLTDSKGKLIEENNSSYRMTTVETDSGGAVLGIEACADHKTWRFSEGGNHYMGTVQKLRIEKIIEGKPVEVMIIEFPPSMSGGKEKYYRDLFAGTLKFRDGTYKIALPKTGAQWDGLKEVRLCPDGYTNRAAFDISLYQR